MRCAILPPPPSGASEPRSLETPRTRSLSITKWIHLRSLNVGLLTFFRRCFDALLPGGRLVLEPQPFSTYARSARASGEATLRDNYARLVEGAEKGWRAEEGDFERVLIELVGFEKRELLGETGKIGALLASPALLLSPRVCPTIG